MFNRKYNHFQNVQFIFRLRFRIGFEIVNDLTKEKAAMDNLLNFD